MSEDINTNYFAYGTPSDPEMIEAIIGRKPEGMPGKLRNYQLAIQTASEIPESVRIILAKNWTAEELSKFASYAICSKAGELVTGTVWKVTDEERLLIDDWELNDGLWYQKADVSVETPEGIVTATTEIMDSDLAPAREIQPDLPLFLVNKKRILGMAQKLRREFHENHNH